MRKRQNIVAMSLILACGLVAHVRAANLVGNASFETPPVNNFQYHPTSSDWVYSANAGLSTGINSGNGFDINGTIPDGGQFAFVQNVGSYVLENVTFPVSGDYTLTYFAAGRRQAVPPTNYGGDTNFDVFVGATLIATGSTTSDTPFTRRGPVTFFEPAGTFPLEFELTSIPANAISDQSVLFDEVSITSVPEPSTLALVLLGGMAFCARPHSALRRVRPWTAIRILLYVAAFGGFLAQSGVADASITFDPSPTMVQASSQFDTVNGYSPYFLFDGSITQADLGTTNNLGNQYASSGSGNGIYRDNDYNPVVSTSYAGPVSANSFVYAQRSGAGGVQADKVEQIRIWFTSSFFVPSLGAGSPANDPLPPGAPNEIVNLSDKTDSNLNEYKFPDGKTRTSQFVTMEFIGVPDNGIGSNPGGYELRLTQDSSVTTPEPASLGLLAMSGMAILTLWRPSQGTRRKRQTQ